MVKVYYAFIYYASDWIVVGQIASMTGGETGNESPLAMEMYGPEVHLILELVLNC